MSTSSTAGRPGLIAKLSYLSLGVADPEAVAEFYVSKLGLQRQESPRADLLRLGLGSGTHVLELRSGDGDTHYGLALSSPEEVERLGSRLRGCGIEIAADHDGALGSDSIVVTDPDGHRIEIHGPVDDSGEATGSPGRRPVRLHHVTVATTSVARLLDFYQDLLGFRVSDRMGDAFAWLRCNREHHTVALVEADAMGLDHYCFEIESWDSVKVWCDELTARGVPVTWGPGRHGPGNNIFIFIDDPVGHRIELSCEMERFWDDVADYRPRLWTPEAKTVNLWGPTPAWRERVAS